MSYSVDLHPRRLPLAGEFYLQADVVQQPRTWRQLSWTERFTRMARGETTPGLNVTLRYREVLDVAPWRVIYSDADPTIPASERKRPLVRQSVWASTWADYVTTCVCVSSAPLTDAELSEVLGFPINQTTVQGDAKPASSDEIDTHAEAYKEVPADDEDDLEDGPCDCPLCDPDHSNDADGRRP